MMVRLALGPVLAGLATFVTRTASASMPAKVYGVNLGSWLVSEPWMFPAEWKAMGGEACDDCTNCIASEFSYAKAFPQTVDAAFNKHWTTWFNQDHVDQFIAAGLNTVRLPLGYWIVEALVDRSKEYYPRGGFKQLRRGLKQLRDANIAVILDHHALPGAQTAGQQFVGQCTHDVQFFTPYNYHRALVWAAVMATWTHLDPAFGSVFAIEAVNEPNTNASQTPGYGDYQKNFVQTIRAVELVMGIPVPGLTLPAEARSNNFTSGLDAIANANIFNAEVRKVLKEAVPILVHMGIELAFPPMFNMRGASINRDAIVTNFMDVSWQWAGTPSNPADAAIGPQAYDNHLYYSFGGVADANEEAYLRHICNLDRVQRAADQRNSPLWFGEWAITTNFDATDAFLMKWADAQKLAYSKGKGWIFWNFKTELLTANGAPLSRQWAYLEGLKRGYFTKDPAAYHDPNVCAPYIGPASSSAAISSTASGSASTLSASSSAIPSSAPTSTASATTSNISASGTTGSGSASTTSAPASAISTSLPASTVSTAFTASASQPTVSGSSRKTRRLHANPRRHFFEHH